jgi:hypothetical protein
VNEGQTGFVIERLPASNEQLKSTPEIANGTHHVQILKCGEPVDNALVIFEVTPKIGEFSKTILGQPKDGYYSFQVPNTNFPLTDHEAFCAKNAEVVELLCIKQVFEKMDEEGSLCVNLSHMIIGIENDPQVQKIIQACKEVAEAIKVTCSIIASDPDLCKKVLVAEYGTPQAVEYTFHLQVSIPGEGTEYSDATTFDPTIPAVFTYIMEPKLSVDLRMYPPDPAPDQSYLASAKILCPDPEGTPVTISVSGSDGYADSNSDVITYNTTISLYIPGAEEGVTDVITLVVGDKSWTQVITF